MTKIKDMSSEIVIFVILDGHIGIVCLIVCHAWVH